MHANVVDVRCDELVVRAAVVVIIYLEPASDEDNHGDEVGVGAVLDGFVFMLPELPENLVLVGRGDAVETGEEALGERGRGSAAAGYGVVVVSDEGEATWDGGCGLCCGFLGAGCLCWWLCCWLSCCG